MNTLSPQERLEAADVLERAADALFIYGRARGAGIDNEGRMCIRGAVQYVRGHDPSDTFGFVANDPAIVALDRHLFAALGPRLFGDFMSAQGRHSSWAWNDCTRDDALVIDTLRRCAKDLRNEAVS